MLCVSPAKELIEKDIKEKLLIKINYIASHFLLNKNRFFFSFKF